MMRLECELDNQAAKFDPGEKATGTVRWQGDRSKAIEIRLFWRTEGKGDQDMEVVDFDRIDDPAPTGEQRFELQLPQNGPYSFSGKLISLVWAVEAVALPSNDADRRDIVCGPGGVEALLSVFNPAPEEQGALKNFIGRLNQ